MKFEIKGPLSPYVEITLDENKTVYTQSGGMAWRDESIEMKTDAEGTFMDGVSRMLSGESYFMNYYTSKKDGSKIAFASSAPGEIIPLDISNNKGVIAQASSFLCAEDSVKFEPVFAKSFSMGLFGEGFVLQNFYGTGMVFLEVDGNICKKELKEGESILVSTGNVVYFDKTCSYELEKVQGTKNILFGEGFYLTRITGPGVVVLQSQSIANLASKISPYISVNRD